LTFYLYLKVNNSFNKALAITGVWQNGFPTLKATTQSHFAKHQTDI